MRLCSSPHANTQGHRHRSLKIDLLDLLFQLLNTNNTPKINKNKNFSIKCYSIISESAFDFCTSSPIGLIILLFVLFLLLHRHLPGSWICVDFVNVLWIFKAYNLGFYLIWVFDKYLILCSFCCELSDKGCEIFGSSVFFALWDLDESLIVTVSPVLFFFKLEALNAKPIEAG